MGFWDLVFSLAEAGKCALGDLWKAFSGGVGRLITFVLLGLGLVAMVCVGLLLGFALATRIFGPVVIGAACVIIAGLFMFSGGCIWAWTPKMGKFLLTAGAVLMIVTALQYKILPMFPGLVANSKATLSNIDREAQVQADLKSSPQQVPCTPPWIIGEKGQEHNRYWFNPDRTEPVCFDRDGRDPEKGTPLAAVTAPVGQILATWKKQHQVQVRPVLVPPPTQAPAPTPPPVPATLVAEATPAPNPVPMAEPEPSPTPKPVEPYWRRYPWPRETQTEPLPQPQPPVVIVRQQPVNIQVRLPDIHIGHKDKNRRR